MAGVTKQLSGSKSGLCHTHCGPAHAAVLVWGMEGLQQGGRCCGRKKRMVGVVGRWMKREVGGGCTRHIQCFNGCISIQIWMDSAFCMPEYVSGS